MVKHGSIYMSELPGKPEILNWENKRKRESLPREGLQSKHSWCREPSKLHCKELLIDKERGRKFW